MIYRILRALALTVLYLVALAGLTVFIESLNGFLLAFLLLTAGYAFIGLNLAPRRRP